MPAVKSNKVANKGQKTKPVKAKAAKSTEETKPSGKRVTFAKDKDLAVAAPANAKAKAPTKVEPKKAAMKKKAAEKKEKPVEKTAPTADVKVQKRKATSEQEEKKPIKKSKASEPKVEKKKTNVAKQPKTEKAPAKKAKKEELSSSDEEDDEQEAIAEQVIAGDDDELTEEQEEALRKAILGDMASDDEDEEDSSDEEVDEDTFETNKEVIAVNNKKLAQSKLETKAKFDKRTPAPSSGDHGIIYLGRIPHGFYEEQMKDYFSQFGTVTQLRLARSKKTGGSKHYAFIEFESKEVAEIVVETMHNYLLFGRMLQCRLIPAEHAHPQLFKNANKKFKVIPWAKVARTKMNKKRSQEQQKKVTKRLVAKEKERREKLQKFGIDYDFPGYESIANQASE
ncbi:uncharacterized protein BYT42DRAFT_566191 [Radiomyces spectabilis]|uniref:uncharacterized protein n=1 Tax=Radiomyces spectabilis TaxID=64574 RepID=UPI00221EC1C2|nr:uncharacterized protein BYT42DRAFT_566191 [Radiomyces spectabilis]KAI8381342.1 hypothetical protein BYT42DRAFT_566191 [Radiomyces spectabilis]